VRVRRLAVLAACSAIAAAGVWWIGGAIAGDAPVAQQPPDAHVLTEAARAGKHVRIEGPYGAIHVWIPPSYRPETGATIVYIHGYYDDADTAYVGHRLAEQFALSALNALFIVPEAPSMTKVPVNYPNLSELIRIVEDHTGVTRGLALTAAVGHSGAYRTIHEWLDEPMLDQIVLIDGMYENEETMEAWLRASPQHRFITVGSNTLPWNEQFLRDMPDTFVVDRVPPTFDTWPAEAKTARIVYVRAQYFHMPLVTDGIVLPATLRLLPVELRADAPWQHPQGGMPIRPDAAIDAPIYTTSDATTDAL
jgi:hypothetical protein